MAYATAQQICLPSILHLIIPSSHTLHLFPPLADHRWKPGWEARIKFLAAYLDLCEESQLDFISQHAEVIPMQFKYHPFCYIKFKEQARIQKQAIGTCLLKPLTFLHGFWFQMGFIWTSDMNYNCPNKKKDWIFFSYDGYISYLLIFYEANQYVWLFLLASKDPPIEIVNLFLATFVQGKTEGGLIHFDNGIKLEKFKSFSIIMHCVNTIMA